MIRLVLSDMDNTLVPFGARHVSSRTIEAIHAALDEGIRFGPATGRDYVELMRFFSMREECFKTGIFSNGKRVRLDGNYISTTVIDHDVLVRLDEVLRPEHGMFLVCFPVETNLFNPAYGINASSAELAEFERLTSFVGGVVDEVPNIDFVAATVACSGGPDRMERCRALVNEAVPEINIVSPIPNWFDVLPGGVSKAAGLEKLVAALGIGLDEVLVFGDAENDLEILSSVPHSVAVANATDQVKQVARHRVGASADEGVAEALFELVRATKAGETLAFLEETFND